MLDEAASTNDEAARLAASGDVAMPFAVRALRQTAGRGQAGRSWWSGPGSLAITVAIDPAEIGLSAVREPRVALATATCLALKLAEEFPFLSGRIGVRWPNDLECDGRKVGGILTERFGHALLVGVGLNISADFEGADAEVRGMATSLAELVGEPARAGDMLERAAIWVCNAVERASRGLAQGDPALMRAWDRLDLLAGMPVRIERAGRVLDGIGLGIDADGCLRVGVSGNVEVIAAGRILRG